MSRTKEPADELDSVTVLMPVYNGEEFLEEQVLSILQQDHVNTRLVILDDCSTDGSLRLARQLEESSGGRIAVLTNEHNLGLIPTVSRLLAGVKTPYFALADQDDIWDANKLSVSVRTLTSTNSALVYSDVDLCDRTGRVTTERYLKSNHIRLLGGREALPFVFRNPVIGHTIVACKAVAERAAEIPAALQFHEIWILSSAAEVGPIAYCDRSLGRYRVHGGNVVGPRRSQVESRGSVKQRVRVRVAYLRRRQFTRAAALAALATRRRDLVPLARAYQVEGLKRIASLMTVLRFLWGRQVRQIGLRYVLAETVLFFVDPEWLVPEVHDG